MEENSDGDRLNWYLGQNSLSVSLSLWARCVNRCLAWWHGARMRSTHLGRLRTGTENGNCLQKRMCPASRCRIGLQPSTHTHTHSLSLSLSLSLFLSLSLYVSRIHTHSHTHTAKRACHHRARSTRGVGCYLPQAIRWKDQGNQGYGCSSCKALWIAAWIDDVTWHWPSNAEQPTLTTSSVLHGLTGFYSQHTSSSTLPRSSICPACRVIQCWTAWLNSTVVSAGSRARISQTW